MDRPRLPPAINGAEQRLDAILAELQGLRQDVQALQQAQAAGTVELREPAAPPAAAPRRGKGGR